MPARQNGIWDFKSYTERTWFRDLIFIFLIAICSYVALHLQFQNGSSNYEYARLNQDQMQFISRIYLDYAQAAKSTPTATGREKGGVKGAENQNTNGSKPPTSNKTAKDSCMSKDTCPCTRVMNYLNTVFEKLEPEQQANITKLLSEANAQEATSFLNGTRFKVHSYFWLIGPSVYWEVVFWSLFGVLCSLLFILGAVGSNATTDLGNPQSQFDSSEILGQVAKMLYAPLCTLTVVLGYNFFKDQNIVDIDSSKGLIVFAFIGGFYSSRVISLMDHLKDVLLPNNGTSALPTIGAAASPSAAIQQLKVQLALNPALRMAVQTVAAGPGLNNATVTMQSAGNPSVMTASRTAGDPDGMFTFSSVTPANYSINVTLGVTPAGGGALTLTGQQTGQILSGSAPITITVQ